MSMESEVWKRVFSEPKQQALGEQLYQLARLSSGALADYRALAAHSRDPEQRMRRLVRWEGENLYCLRGLFLLAAGREMGPLPEPPQDRQGREGAFLYHRSVEQLQAYTALSAQPGYGVSFGEMVRRQVKICEGIAGFLGRGQENRQRNVRR